MNYLTNKFSPRIECQQCLGGLWAKASAISSSYQHHPEFNSISMVMEIFGSIFLCVLCSCWARRRLLLYQVCDVLSARWAWARLDFLSAHKGSCQRTWPREREIDRETWPLLRNVLFVLAANCCCFFPPFPYLFNFFAILHFGCRVPRSALLCSVSFVFMDVGEERREAGANAPLILEIKLHLTVDCAHNCRALPWALASK